jgi:hypothetical protein
MRSRRMVRHERRDPDVPLWPDRWLLQHGPRVLRESFLGLWRRALQRTLPRQGRRRGCVHVPVAWRQGAGRLGARGAMRRSGRGPPLPSSLSPRPLCSPSVPRLRGGTRCRTRTRPRSAPHGPAPIRARGDARTWCASRTARALVSHSSGRSAARRSSVQVGPGSLGGSPKSPTITESGTRVSNPRPSAWEADALPTELVPRRFSQLPLTSQACQPVVPRTNDGPGGVFGPPGPFFPRRPRPGDALPHALSRVRS